MRARQRELQSRLIDRSRFFFAMHVKEREYAAKAKSYVEFGRQQDVDGCFVKMTVNDRWLRLRCFSIVDLANS